MSPLLRILFLACLLLPSIGCDQRVVEKHPVPTGTPSINVVALDRNVLINGDAEVIVVSEKAPQKAVPASWKECSDTFSIEYGDAPEEWPDAKPGCPDGRQRYFRFGLALNEPGKTISQSIGLGALQADIDTGHVECALGGWFGGWTDGDASSCLEVDFLNAEGHKISTLATKPPIPAELPKPTNGRAALAKVLNAGPVPSGTRAIEVRLVSVRMSTAVESNTVAAADNLSVVLRKKGH